MMDRRTFTLQLRDKPPRWLPHKHRCPDCCNDHWCTYRDGWLPCQGLLTYQRPVVVTPWMERFLANDPHAKAMIKSRVDRVRRADYIFVDDPMVTA